MESIRQTEKDLMEIRESLTATEAKINSIVLEMQKTETKQSNSKLVR